MTLYNLYINHQRKECNLQGLTPLVGNKRNERVKTKMPYIIIETLGAHLTHTQNYTVGIGLTKQM